MIADTSSLPLNSMMEGEYLITFNFHKIGKGNGDLVLMKKDTKIGCLSFTCIVEPAAWCFEIKYWNKHVLHWLVSFSKML